MLDSIEAFIGWFLGLLSADQWDAWRNWLATIGGLVGLTIVVATFRSNVRMRRVEQARFVFATAQPHIISAGTKIVLTYKQGDKPNFSAPRGVAAFEKTGETEWTVVPFAEVLRIDYVVHNGSKERIGPLLVEAYNLSAEEMLDGAEYRYQHIDPESDLKASILAPNPRPGSMPSVGATLRFDDASGQHWKRHLLERVKPGARIPQISSKGRYWVRLDEEPTDGGAGAYRLRIDKPESTHRAGRFRLAFKESFLFKKRR